MKRCCLLLTAALLASLMLPGAARAAQPQPETVGQKLLSIDAMDTDISVLLRALADESGQNIIIGKGVSGKVAAKLKDLPLPDILTHLSRSYGLDWTVADGAYVVTAAGGDVKKDDPAPAPTVTAVWQCRYHRQDELATMLTKLFPGLTVTAGPSHADPELDGSADAAGASLSSSSGGSGGSGDATALAPGAVILLGTQSQIDTAIDLLAKVDVRRPQVVIEASVSELSDDFSKKLGLTWSWSSLVVSETPATNGIAFGSFNREGLTFEGILEALSKDDRAKILARPSLSVVDGGHGSILIGDRLIYPKVIGYTQLNTPIYDIEEEKVGIYLQVAPVIGDDGYITMTVYPQVSVIKGFLNVQGSQYPQIATREAKTTVRMKQGEPLAIGGLMRDTEIDTITKVPVLGELPVLKSLFRHRSKTSSRTEIVIILTPRIVGEAGETAAAAPAPGATGG